MGGLTLVGRGGRDNIITCWEGGGGGCQKAVTKLLLDKHSKTKYMQCKSLDKTTGLLFKSEQKLMDGRADEWILYS